jgi:hypothetical protein
MGFQKITWFRNAKPFQIGVNFSFFSVQFGRLSESHFAFSNHLFDGFSVLRAIILIL